MSAKRYTEEFRIEAVDQATDRGHPVAEVTRRLDVTSHSRYQWIRRHRVPEADRQVADNHNAELRRLKAELRRVPEEQRPQTGYHRRISHRGSPVAITAPNNLQRQFDVVESYRV